MFFLRTIKFTHDYEPANNKFRIFSRNFRIFCLISSFTQNFVFLRKILLFYAKFCFFILHYFCTKFSHFFRIISALFCAKFCNIFFAKFPHFLLNKNLAVFSKQNEAKFCENYFSHKICEIAFFVRTFGS